MDGAEEKDRVLASKPLVTDCMLPGVLIMLNNKHGSR